MAMILMTMIENAQCCTLSVWHIYISTVQISTLLSVQMQMDYCNIALH